MAAMRVAVPRRSWPFLKTPLAIYLIVMLPVCGLMVFLLVTNTEGWMKGSAAAVLALTLVGFVRGYVRRLVLTGKGARLIRCCGTIDIPWERVARVGVYIPGGGVGATEYAYITTRDAEPLGKWDLDGDTIQIQNRPGLLDAIERARAAHQHESTE